MIDDLFLFLYPLVYFQETGTLLLESTGPWGWLLICTLGIPVMLAVSVITMILIPVTAVVLFFQLVSGDE